ncbi:hypothetical protein ACFQ07_23545 [Actinomadura adrarensis]|uniref:Uncharacterized protein n=1 Tax=Actinomadura adrarensis TaxID=1819600 RepID=A0ABW3CML9_9ACTN
MGIAEEIAAAVAAHSAVERVEPIGSGARDIAGFQIAAFSVIVDDFGEVAADLPDIVGPFDPLSAQWDPLGEHASQLLIFRGPVKVDLVFPEVWRNPNPPWRVGPDTLAAIDTHFWDWTLWLVGKRRDGMLDRVRGELLKMSRHLLQPLGIGTVPLSLGEAADRYVRARDRLESRYGTRISRCLQDEILPLVRAPHGDHYRPSGLPS